MDDTFGQVEYDLQLQINPTYFYFDFYLEDGISFIFIMIIIYIRNGYYELSLLTMESNRNI